MEPHLAPVLSGALHWTDPVSVDDPQGLAHVYLRLFERLGGRFVQGNAASLEADGRGWRLRTAHGPLAAGAAVIALGPWSDVLTQALGYDLPLAVKRGYHMHYRPAGEARLNHPMLDTERGYFLAPMRQGIRLTTGAEFALPRRDQDARAARPRGADRARSLSARRAPRHRAVDGRAPLHAGHAADHRQERRATPISGSPSATRTTGSRSAPVTGQAARRDDHGRGDVRRSGAVLAAERFGYGNCSLSPALVTFTGHGSHNDGHSVYFGASSHQSRENCHASEGKSGRRHRRRPRHRAGSRAGAGAAGRERDRRTIRAWDAAARRPRSVRRTTSSRRSGRPAARLRPPTIRWRTISRPA